MSRRRKPLALASAGLAAVAALWFALETRRDVASEPTPNARAAPVVRVLVPPAPTLAAGTSRPRLPGTGATVETVPLPSEETNPVESLHAVVVQVNSLVGTPIPDARVALDVERENEPRVTRSDTSGAARFERVPGRAVNARADAEGFAGNALYGYAIPAPAEGRVSLVLTPGVPFDGVVVAWPDEEPVAGANVWLAPSGAVAGYTADDQNRVYGETKTDARGRFHVPGVAEAQRVLVLAAAPGFVDGGLRVQVLDGRVSPTPVAVRLARAGRLVGIVRDPQGNGVAGATVYVLPSADAKDLKWNLVSNGRRTAGLVYTPAAQGISGEDGTYAVDGLLPGDEYVAVAAARGFTRSEAVDHILVARAPPDTRVDCSLRAPGTVVVTALDLAGTPLTGDTIATLWAETTDRPWGVPEKDAPHVTRFDGLEADDYELRVRCDSYRSATRSVHVGVGEAIRVEVRLDPGVRLDGLAVGEDGGPVAGAIIDARALSGGSHGIASTNAQGQFVIRALEPEEYELSAVGQESVGVRLHLLETVRVRAPGTGVRLVLGRLGTASIRIVTPSGDPFVGVVQVQRWIAGEEHREDSIDEVEAVDGRLNLTDLPVGDIELALRVPGFLRIHPTFTTRPRSNTDLGTVHLDPGIRLVVRVTDLAGAPLAGARVNDERADAAGTWELPHLPAGVTRVTARAQGFLDRVTEVDVRPGSGPLVVALARGALVRVTARRADGTAAGDATLRATPLSDPGSPREGVETQEEVLDDSGQLGWRLAAGRWRLACVLDDVESVLGEWTLAEGEGKDLELVLPHR